MKNPKKPKRMDNANNIRPRNTSPIISTTDIYNQLPELAGAKSTLGAVLALSSAEK